MQDKQNIPPEEASAVMRGLARTLRDMYVALLAEGFTEQQANGLLGVVLAEVVQAGTNKG